MTPTTDYLRAQFALFNARYFGGELPEPQFKVNSARTLLGRFSFRRVRKGLLGLRHSEEYSIAVSRFYEMSERDVQTVLLHEMIHFHICYHRLADTSSHGPLFRREMQRINADGWNITVRTSTRGWQINGGKDRPKRCVVALTMPDGYYFAAVQRPYVHAFNAALDRIVGGASSGNGSASSGNSSNFGEKGSAASVKTNAMSSGTGSANLREWFFTGDEFFVQYPLVRTLRFRKVSAAEFASVCLRMRERGEKLHL